jgi:Trypsin
VRLGEHKISTDIDCDSDGFCQDPVQDIAIERTLKHPNYDWFKRINDIAILRLKTAADVTKRNVNTICLPTSANNQIEVIDAIAREKMAISGWGKIESGEASDVLMRANVPFVENEECFNRFARINLTVYETYLCAGGKNKTDVNCFTRL